MYRISHNRGTVGQQATDKLNDGEAKIQQKYQANTP
jgi:hypothetical protein